MKVCSSLHLGIALDIEIDRVKWEDFYPLLLELIFLEDDRAISQGQRFDPSAQR
jgi:hypothetical protein